MNSIFSPRNGIEMDPKINQTPETSEKSGNEATKLPETSDFSKKKIVTLDAFENNWRNKNVRTILGEYIHMFLIYKNYQNYKDKSLNTDDPAQYEQAFQSFLEFAADRKEILKKLLENSGVKFTATDEIEIDSLDEELRKFMFDQIDKNQSDPEFIIKSSLKDVSVKDFGQSQYLYELLPFISKIPAIKEVLKKLSSKYNLEFFLFLGTINDMKVRDDEFFVFDVDFCTKKRSNSFDAYSHEEFRDFNFPLWISTSISNGKLNILIRTIHGNEDIQLLNETFDLNSFPNFEKVFEYASQQIIDRSLIDRLSVGSISK